jgi:hypothetical protein
MSEHQPPDEPSANASVEAESEPLPWVPDRTRAGLSLELLDEPFEQSYRLNDSYTTKLFLEVCRSRELLPYRHRRQHSGTICVRASVQEHDALWTQYCELSRELQARLHTLTLAFVKATLTPPKL